ncbi:MAG TPA: hypothetical protein VEQ58_12545 [Polyangiaceae bacterium]|nr:hypothetical protein [Polyangiaceae bacterium]
MRISTCIWALAATLATASVSAEPLALATLATGTSLPPQPVSAKPFFIGAEQAVAGLQLVNMQRFARQPAPGYHEYMLFSDAARARGFEAQLKSGEETTFSRSESCFATSSGFGLPKEMNRAVEWDTFMPDRLSLQSYAGDNTSPKVIPVRVERWIEADGKVRVETTEVWADTRSGGIKLVAHAENELTRVASPFAGVAVYALRTGPAAVSFFVRRDSPRNPAQPDVDPFSHLSFVRFGLNRTNAFDLNAFRTSVAGEVHPNPCAFEHVELEIRPDAPPVAAEKTKDASPPPTPPREMANSVFAVVLDLDLEPVKDPAVDRERRTAQLRAMQVNFGLTRSPSGEAPLPTVSYRWVDRLRAVQF